MMKEFPSSIIASLESLFLEFNFRRLLFWVFVVFAVVTGFTVFENLTGYAYFSRMEKKVAILKSLNELAQDEISTKPELNSIYQDVTSELESYQIKPLSFSGILSGLGPTAPQIPAEFGKFISGGLLGFMVAIAGLVDRKKGGEKWRSTFLGGLVFGILMGLIGIVIPTIYNLWINYIGFPVIQIGVILLFSRKTAKR